ncbi:hypothetical protein ON003_13095 [Janibacter hoylei]|uniref:hypothetical protein n=1 Tax=Janibacter hoylei TaxID=364298 RepID=UPI002238FA9C|nr:hypothetical protein [Janibacter hoylei]MCW4602439.1 hypothetical protein [Janibacter hoylei]
MECTDKETVVFHLDQPVGNFDEVVSLPEFAPYKQSREGDDAAYEAFSSGPYKLSDAWTPSKGGTWVRNAEWDEDSDPCARPGPGASCTARASSPRTPSRRSSRGRTAPAR